MMISNYNLFTYSVLHTINMTNENGDKMELKLIEKRKATASELFVYEGFGYEVNIRIWNDGENEITTKPIGDILFLPDVDFIEGKCYLSFSDISNIGIDSIHKLLRGIDDAKNLCIAMKNLEIIKKS